MAAWKLPRVLALVAFGALVIGVLTSLADESAQSPPEKVTKMAPPEYDASGSLLRPEGYERWTLVGTSIGLDYSKDKEEGAEKTGIFHNVYMQPEAFDHYVETGEFPEQTVFVVTNNPPTKRKGEDEINRHGHFAGNTTGLEVSVKDSKKFEEGWGYYMFYGADGKRTASKPSPRSACYDCHATHGEDDAVFVQFYSVLKAARAKKVAAQ